MKCQKEGVDNTSKLSKCREVAQSCDMQYSAFATWSCESYWQEVCLPLPFVECPALAGSASLSAQHVV
jgi:hypothetical protein